MENKMEAIICSNVNKSYGKKEVLKNIDFTLEKGKCNLLEYLTQ